MKLDRVKNAKRNIAFGIINKIITLSLPFIVRMVVIREIGAEYLGLGSLFTSILQVLNITELGFSSAVVYSMYKPIANDDNETLCAILSFYKKVYFVIGIIIGIFGLILMPFLPNFIKGYIPEDINIYILYLIYLLSTVISYLLFAYKNSLISAYQREDVLSNINTIVHIAIYIAQFIFIVVTKNYYYYALTLLIGAFIQNIVTELVSKKLFPHIIGKGCLSNEIRKDIIVKVKGLLINKLCAVSRNSFDSIFVSAFLGLTQTAIYNNYYYIMNSVIILLGVLSSSILAGVGNSIVTETQQKNYADMKKFNFIYMWLSGWCTICLLCLYQPFINFAFGREMLFPFPVVILFCLYFYVLKIGDIRATYSEARGLWWENRYRAIIEAVANLVLNFILGKFFGIYGIVIATLISLFFVNFLWGSSIIFKYYFTEIKMYEYYLHHLLYAFVTAIICCITFFICSNVNINGFLGLLLKFVICALVPPPLYFIFYYKFSLFKISKNWVIDRIIKKNDARF